ncbi:hypothetical protein MRB53_001078 [Persea americana]|uniref:Uncharacterized protein n=1 Tax=Persea americana TaxID=3435 RepID=A0ACC2MQQ1_PERAE|nr:hypothetical protein MRB53_001078 [Persea americana]
MSIEALAMAGIHYLECSTDVEVSDAGEVDEPPLPPRLLVKEELEDEKEKKKKESSFGACMAMNQREMKEFLLAWAKEVAATENAFTPNETGQLIVVSSEMLWPSCMQR